jgi:uncharacterized protein YukE
MSTPVAAGGAGGTVTISGPSGNAQALLSLAAELDAHAGTMSALGSTIKRTTGQIAQSAEWTGAAADAYTAFCGGTSTSVGDLAGPLHEIATAVREFASKLSSAQQSVDGAVESAQHAAGAAAQGAVSAAQQAASEANGAVEAAASAAAELVGKASDEFDKIMEESEPVRSWIEKVHLPWDLGGGLAWELAAMKPADKAVEAASDFVKELPKLNSEMFEEVNALAHEADNGLASWDDVAEAAARWTAKTDAAAAFGSQWLDSAEGLLSKLKWVGRATGVLSLIGDVGTIWKPEDGGALGWVDRGAAIVNAAAVTTDLVTSTAAGSSFVAGLAGANALDEVPVVGEVVMVADVATGLYLGTDYVIHHWAGISHGAETAAKAVGHAAVATEHAVAGAAQDVGHAAASAAKDVGHDVSSAVSTVTSWL